MFKNLSIDTVNISRPWLLSWFISSSFVVARSSVIVAGFDQRSPRSYHNHNSTFTDRNQRIIPYSYRSYSVLLSPLTTVSVSYYRRYNKPCSMDNEENVHPTNSSSSSSALSSSLSPSRSLNKSSTSTPKRSPSPASIKRKRLRKNIDSEGSDMENTTATIAVADTVQTAEKPPAKSTVAPSPDTNTVKTVATATTTTTTTSAKPIHPFFAPRPAKPTPTVPATAATTTASSSTVTTTSTNTATVSTTVPVPTTVAPPSTQAVTSAAHGTTTVITQEEDEEEESISEIKKKSNGTVTTATTSSTTVEKKKKKAKTVTSDAEHTSADDMDSATYHPVRNAPWKGNPGMPIPYGALVSVFADIEATTKRIAITNFLTNFFRSVIALCPDDLVPVLYLCTNSIAPAYENLELGVGDSLLIKALSEATGRQGRDIKAEMEEKGDLGLVAETSRSRQRTLFASATASASSSLTVRSVFATFRSIAAESGRASQEKKVAAIKRLLVSCQGAEAKYIIRSMQGKLRIGLAQQTVLIALANAFVLTSPLIEGISAGRSEVYGPPERGGATNTSSSSSTTPALSAYPPVLIDTSRKPDLEARLEEGVAIVKQVFSELPSYDAIVPVLLRRGLNGARQECQLVPGIPVTPMLAKPTKGIREVLDRFENVPFTCEWKYDGERAQVHVLSDGTVRIFSRNSEDTTSKYPDLGIALKMAMGRIQAEPIYPTTGNNSTTLSSSNTTLTSDSSSSSSSSTASATDVPAGTALSATPFFKPSTGTVPRVPVVSCVLDGESVAYDREKGVLLPFQILSTRARKDVDMENIKVQVIYVAFDCLYLNNQSLLHTPLKQRREALRSAFTEIPGRFAFAQAAESNDTEEIGAFLNDAVKGGCEGLMVKVLEGNESVYEPSKRSLNWLKLKKDYMDGLTDSFDLVPVAAWKGKGKRTGVYGAYLLACYDPENDDYQSVCKVGTGFSDEALVQLAAVFNDNKECIRTTKPRNVVVGESLSDADVWFTPEDSEVWEVMAADLSISPVHMGAVGKVDPSRGIGLRFPRFLRRRDASDKGPTDATTASQILDMYRNQASVSASGGMMDDDDDY